MDTSVSEVVLTPADIPGADLSEPYESHTILALRWWLLCRGIKAPSSWKKNKLVERIHKANADGASIVDVDGSYLYQKHKALSDAGHRLAPLDHPAPPPSGWVTVSSENYLQVAPDIPTVTAGLVYTYLAGHVGRSSNQGAFRALTRGYAHWASGRLEQLSVNTNNPKYCHIRATMKPSMKTGLYHVYLLLECDDKGLASIVSATCECAAGKSASCTHVSAVLHALCGMKPTSFQLQPNIPFSMEEETLPVTSYLCQWKVPKQRKESNIPMSEAVFEKHEYSKPKKRKIQPVEAYDPRPPEFRGTAPSRLPALLDDIRGEQLCVSLLFDESCRHWNTEGDEEHTEQPSTHQVPSISALRATMSAFKESQCISAEKAREIEQNTRDQRLSTLWFSSRRYKVTASNFGPVLTLKRETPPDNLVLQILQPKTFSTTATRYGIDYEPRAIEQYVSHQKTHGHPDLTVSASGFIINTTHPFLGASPDGAVYDPVDYQQPFGFLEIKCPYSVQNLTPAEACSAVGFCCTVDATSGCLHLKEGHRYYAQVQGQMAIGGRPWCDFVVFTKKGISVQRIPFDEDYWENRLLPKLIDFYDSCVLPEIVSPIHALGLPIRDLRS